MKITLTQEQQQIVKRFAENFIKVNAVNPIDAIKLSLLFKIKEDFYKKEEKSTDWIKDQNFNFLKIMEDK